MLTGKQHYYLLTGLRSAVFIWDEAPVKVDRRSQVTSLWLESNLATRHVTLPDGKSLLDPQAKPRPRPIQNLPLDQLQLEAKTHNALIKAGIVTIGQLFQAKISYLCSLQGFHLDSFSDINGALTALNDAIR